MKARFVLGILLLISIAISLSAQNDSTFVRYYSPTSETHPFWYSLPSYDTNAANVFEKYDGNFGMQILSTFHSPPPELVIPLSPIASYNRSGEYINTTFGPYNDDGLLVGYYSHIIKDGYGGYLALDMFEHRIHRLNSDLQFVEWVRLLCVNGTPGGILDLISEDNGFIVVAHLGDNVIAKFDFELNCLWSTPLPVNQHKRFKKLLDGSYIILWRYNPYFRVMKVSSTGDSIWVKQVQCEVVDDFIEINNRFFGLKYNSININTAELRVYDFGIDFENENPGDPILVIPTYPLLDNNPYGLGEPFSVIRTSDDCIILAVSTPIGEIFKYDSNFNLLWSSNALQNERIGIGSHPLIELGNGDLLYCATVGYQPRQLALVRIDSNGNYVGIDDDTEQTPTSPNISAYPNPMRSNLNIEIKLVSKFKPTDKNICIYNTKGQLVRQIQAEYKSTHILISHWDGCDASGRPCASGVYFMKYKDSIFDLAKKIMVIK